MTVTGEKADMRGKKGLTIQAGGHVLVHKFWLANIRDPCIIGLDLLKRWRALVDVSKATITLGTETLALQSGRRKKKQPNGQRTSRQAAAALQAPSHCVSPSASTPTSVPAQPQPAPASSPEPAVPPSAETTEAIKDLWQRSKDGLNPQQCQELKQLLEDYMDIFAARDEDCKHTGLVQHAIDTGSAKPIRQRPHRLSLAKRQVAEDKIREMLAAGVIEPSDSPWAAPVVLVRKKDGSWRFCVDY